MASALLADRNESCWTERKVYMRKNPNLKANPSSRSKRSPNKQICDPSIRIYGRKTDESAVTAPVASNDSSSLNRKFVSLNHRRESSLDGYVTFNIALYSRRKLKDLKKRLLAELEQVRILSDRIESREFQSRNGYNSSQLSGGYRGRDAPDAFGDERLKEKQTSKENERNPSENLKKISGIKRPLPSISSKDSKRLALEPEARKKLSIMMKKCGHFLSKLMKHKHAWIFNVPVDVAGLGLHDYNQIIKHPMDLGSVKSKLGKNLYASPLDFATDVRLTFENALVYNPKGHDVYVMAEQMLASFEEMFEPEYKKYKNKEREIQWSSPNQIRALETATKPDPTPVLNLPRPSPTQAEPSVKFGKQPKPKAKDPHKREMSFEEKQMLSMNLQSLPQEKMDQVVQIIKKRNANLAQHDDEIEVDIEVVDNETLWELERFVGYCKKMMSKIKRQAVAINQNSLAAQGNKVKALLVHNSDEEMPEVAVSSKKSTKGETGSVEEDVDIGEEMPANNFPPVEIDKDAGSSSSSSDNSSSSDSDSGSSSGSDSDADDAESPGH